MAKLPSNLRLRGPFRHALFDAAFERLKALAPVIEPVRALTRLVAVPRLATTGANPEPRLRKIILLSARVTQGANGGGYGAVLKNRPHPHPSQIARTRARTLRLPAPAPFQKYLDPHPHPCFGPFEEQAKNRLL